MTNVKGDTDAIVEVRKVFIQENCHPVKGQLKLEIAKFASNEAPMASVHIDYIDGNEA